MDNNSIFTTTSDTEVVLYLIETSKQKPFILRIINAYEKLKGAYSFVFITEDKLVTVRNPFGFRPLVMGKRSNAIYEREVVVPPENFYDDVEARNLLEHGVSLTGEQLSYYSSKRRKEFLVLTCGQHSINVSISKGKNEDGDSYSDKDNEDEENQTVIQIGSVGKGLYQGVKLFFTHTEGIEVATTRGRSQVK
ncbi:hypothetical protein JHK82_035535 [Glycine max]|nr:hypothetical protein JHK85_036256 [Glycine max]KAG4976191.1 hypothetical protein JHK86_035665 [Glycine max]KAG5112266.1 hypothetical protein JHK82_035535 [Glycine max]